VRQIWITHHGPPEVLEEREAPEPLPRAGEVRIRVEASGLNFDDVLGRAGKLPGAPELPYVPGAEVAGVVDLVGQGVPELREGDAVLAATRFGGYADTICVPWRQVFRRLEWMSAQDAAALPVNYLLAYALLVVMGSLRKGDTVLIHRAAGATGLAALDICRIVGAETFGTAAPEKHDFLRERGLDHPIDYYHYDYEREIRDLRGGRGVQLILDSLGGSHWRKNYRLLMPTGRVLHYGTGDPPRSPAQRWSLQGLGRFLAPAYTPERLIEDNKGVLGVRLADLWEQGDLLRGWMDQIIQWYDEALFRPHIDRTFSFAEVAEAHYYLQNRKNLGKVLVLP
jgi:synaptic vesicle membrane protein VAT-1